MSLESCVNMPLSTSSYRLLSASPTHFYEYTNAPAPVAIGGGILRAKRRSGQLQITHQKKVRFASMEIHHHNTILGDNPGSPSTTGASLTIDWEVLNSRSLSVDTFEETRGPRQSKKDLKLSKESRAQLLRRAGFSPAHIQMATNLAQAIRNARKISAQDCPNDTLDPSKQIEATQALYARIYQIQAKVKVNKHEEQHTKGKGIFRNLFAAKLSPGRSFNPVAPCA